jgi:hypothetical protein
MEYKMTMLETAAQWRIFGSYLGKGKEQEFVESKVIKIFITCTQHPQYLKGLFIGESLNDRAMYSHVIN